MCRPAPPRCLKCIIIVEMYWLVKKKAGYFLFIEYPSGGVPSAAGCIALFHGKGKGSMRVVVSRMLLR